MRARRAHLIAQLQRRGTNLQRLAMRVWRCVA